MIGLRDRLRGRTWLVAGIVAVAAGAAVLAQMTVLGIHGGGAGAAAVATLGQDDASAGTSQRFVYLAAQQTNFCGLQPSAVLSYPDDQSMQGSCCSAMDMTKYQTQVGALRSYARIPEIPRDPYDIRAGLAKTLLGYDRTIVLSAHDQATFDAAMQLTLDKGPCCCHCWRWNATEGLDKELIA